MNMAKKNKKKQTKKFKNDKTINHCYYEVKLSISKR